MEKKNKLKIIHIVLIILGIIFILIPQFHSNMWFDESYSVSIADKSFSQIWSIGKNDVHPVFYYWILHIINLIFGSNVLIYRLFSTLCISILGILGFTHIRKDFGEKTGILFSFFAFFFPINVVYAGEIRMYPLAMLLVTLMAIYAYRIYKNKENKNIKNWILFAIFSLASAYTHYYALMAAGIINIMLFVRFIIDAKKEKKFTYNLKVFLLQAVIQILLYLPWILALLLQMGQVHNGFWIGITFPDFFVEFFTFQFTGNLDDNEYVPQILAIIFGILICAYMIYLYAKNKKEEELKPAKLSIAIWFLVALGACVVSLIIWSPIIYARYMLCVTGLLIFFITYTMSEKGNAKINIAICAISFILSVIAVVNLVQENYAQSNTELTEYLSSVVEDGDVFICGNEGSGFVVSAMYVDHKLYFYDEAHWEVEPAYKAFGTDMESIYSLEDLEDYTGRIIIINAGTYMIYEQLDEMYDDIELIEQKSIDVEYKGYKYTFAIVEKN